MVKKPKPAPVAAIFDLDRTLLRGASGPIISAELKSAGLIPARSNPLEPLLFGLFDLVGENWPTMMLTRQAVRVTRGWSTAAVKAAGERAAEQLERLVLPYARAEIARHRAAGRTLVMATTTPDDLIRPLANLLGFDEVIATRYRGDGSTYAGAYDGNFIWGKGKAEAVLEWATERGVDLAASYAYSDSYYDVPLLSSVGHPHVVNPDPRLTVVAAARRWSMKWFDVPASVPKVLGVEPQQILLALTRPEFLPFVRFRFYGTERVPTVGPAILVANHRSYFDPIALGMLLTKVGRPVRFLGKKEVFDAPVIGDIARAMGGISVDRGTGDDAPLEAAREVLDAGDLVAIMPQGTIPRGADFFEPTLQGRWGAVRLAAEAGVPLVPIGLWGTEAVWPRSSRVPFVQNVLKPPVVTVKVGNPFEVGSGDPAVETAQMMERITALLPAAARRRRKPTAAQLAATMPPGTARP
jgi:putative phosphoserine phosphatase/1-acylglycerol-3-phosphate O-acyltransferase